MKSLIKGNHLNVTCSECGGHTFFSLCAHCSKEFMRQDIAKAIATARDEALRDAADRAVAWLNKIAVCDDWPNQLRAAILADNQEVDNG